MNKEETPLEKQIDLIWQGAAAVAEANIGAESNALDGQLCQVWREACLSLQSHPPPEGNSGAVYGHNKNTHRSDVEILFGSSLPTNKTVLIGTQRCLNLFSLFCLLR